MQVQRTLTLGGHGGQRVLLHGVLRLQGRDGSDSTLQAGLQVTLLQRLGGYLVLHILQLLRQVQVLELQLGRGGGHSHESKEKRDALHPTPMWRLILR
jgi:hypothetical protein